MNTFKVRLLSVFMLAALLAAFPNLHAQAYSVVYVDRDATGLNDGSSWKNAYTSLQSALGMATKGVEIWVAEGVYKPTTGADRNASFRLKNGVTIYGGFAGNETLLTQRDPVAHTTTLSGAIGRSMDNNSYHVVMSAETDATAVLDGFTVAYGNANNYYLNKTDSGGGMYNDSGSPTLRNITFSQNDAVRNGGGMYSRGKPMLRNVTFSGNTADYAGGGMYNDSGSPTLRKVTFSKNSAPYGGGMSNSSSDLTLVDVAFSDNSASYNGGGIYNDAGHSTLTGVTFSNNSATDNGGGIYNRYSALTLSDVTFSNNSACDGGGMYNDSSSPTLTGVKFSNNSAAEGGGMHNNSGSPSLKEVVFSGNTASKSGGGMYSLGKGNPMLTNVTFSGNSAEEGGGMLNGDTATLTDITFDNNSATAGGGMSDYGNSILTNITFSKNTASYGGGMINLGDATLTNVTFSGNTASKGGGGMQNIGAPNLTNVTFSGNSAGDEGGGLRNDGKPTLRNTILWGNSAPNGSQVYDNGGQVGCNPVTIYDSVVQDDCPAGSICKNIITKDPLLGTLGNYGGSTQTIPLQSGSSAIDVGDDASCPATDQRGVTRPQGSRCDIGAYEAVATPVVYDDSHVVWSYTGGWITFTGSGPYNNTLHYTDTVGGSAEVLFQGTQFSLTYTKASNRGSIEVYVDNVLVGTINASSSSTLWQQTWTSPVVASGSHTARFVHAGGGTYIDIDAITILP